MRRFTLPNIKPTPPIIQPSAGVTPSPYISGIFRHDSLYASPCPSPSTGILWGRFFGGVRFCSVLSWFWYSFTVVSPFSLGGTVVLWVTTRPSMFSRTRVSRRGQPFPFQLEFERRYLFYRVGFVLCQSAHPLSLDCSRSERGVLSRNDNRMNFISSGNRARSPNLSGRRNGLFAGMQCSK